MLMVQLKRPLLQVQTGTSFSFGGSQMFSDDKTIRKCGCGPVAALNTLCYLCNCDESLMLTKSEHNALLSDICSRYFPLIPPFGISGPLFVIGLNRLFSDRNVPYHAALMLSGEKLWSRTENMLSRDLPVILTVGINFPLFWRNVRLPFYVCSPQGEYRRATAAKAHFVTVTGIDEEWLCISSWGRRYYINRREYDTYTRKNSMYLLSNILFLSE